VPGMVAPNSRKVLTIWRIDVVVHDRDASTADRFPSTTVVRCVIDIHSSEYVVRVTCSSHWSMTRGDFDPVTSLQASLCPPSVGRRSPSRVSPISEASRRLRSRFGNDRTLGEFDSLPRYRTMACFGRPGTANAEPLCLHNVCGRIQASGGSLYQGVFRREASFCVCAGSVCSNCRNLILRGRHPERLEGSRSTNS
jgi:hypothetical protein